MIHNSPLALPNWDLQRCFDIVGISRWQRLAGQRLFITGGTGFVGKWLLGTLMHANETLDLDCQVTVLSRHPATFLRDWPLVSPQIKWIAGDVINIDLSSESYDIIIHAATDVASQISYEEHFYSISEGTRRIVKLARQGQDCRLLLVSSGAVYGQPPAHIQQIPETYGGFPNTLKSESGYGEGKRLAERLVADAAELGGIIFRVARLFSTVGPHFPLDQHFAIGNFIRDALANRLIVINGDGSPVRSYIYAADMAGWLWSILLEKTTPSTVYNVGSNQSISILGLAQLVNQTIRSNQCVELNNGYQLLGSKLIRTFGANRYVPDCNSAMQDLNLPQPIDLAQAIKRTSDWYRFFA